MISVFYMKKTYFTRISREKYFKKTAYIFTYPVFAEYETQPEAWHHLCQAHMCRCQHLTGSRWQWPGRCPRGWPGHPSWHAWPRRLHQQWAHGSHASIWGQLARGWKPERGWTWNSWEIIWEDIIKDISQLKLEENVHTTENDQHLEYLFSFSFSLHLLGWD